jgi:uncharacterized protein (TIGR02099 family)
MPAGTVPTPVSVPRRVLAGGVRWIGIAIVIAIAVFCALLLVVGVVAFPRIEAHRDDIAGWLTRELKQPVEIDAIVTGWDGWNPRLAVRGLRVLDATGDPTQPPLLELPDVSGTVSWTSVLLGELRLRELTIVAPRLAVRRDASGRVHVAGFEIDPHARNEEVSLTDWLLRQRLIVVRDALVTWDDEQRNAPQLLLDNVDFRLESRFSQHRFGLTGTPMPEVASPIDLRGEVSSASLADWRKGAGRLYLRLDYADVAIWSEWLPLPVAVERGEGAMRVWFDFDHGVARRVVADVELADVRSRLATDLPSLDLSHVAGRFTWTQEGARRSLATRGLELAMPAAARIAPGDVDVHYGVGEGGAATNGRIKVGRLELAPLTQIAAKVPLPASLREDLGRYGARGTLAGAEYAWEGPLATPTSFKAHGAFTDLGVNARDAMPGLAGLSGTFEATEARGALRIASKRLMVAVPKVFAEPLLFDSAAARVRWERSGESLLVRLDDVDFANPHAAGSAQGTWRSRGTGPGEIDLGATVKRADAKQLYRYVPLVVSAETRRWIRDSLIGGRTDEAKLTLKGDLARFPFTDGKSGQFLVTVKARDAVLDYANGWPRLEGLDADVQFQGHGLRIVASKGALLGTRLERTTATIADMSLEYPHLAIEGEANGATAEFLRFIAQSPLAEWTDRFTEGAKATGDGRLALNVAFDLGKPDEIAKVSGHYDLVDNALQLPGVPPLAKVTGRIDFTEREASARDLAFDTLGGSGRVAVSSADGVLRISGEGRADVDAIERSFGAPLADRASGITDWQLELASRKSVASWTIRSTLRGAAIDLPAPLGKRAEDAVALRVERRPPAAAAGRETFAVDYGSTMRVVAQRRGSENVDRVLVLLGKAAAARGAEPERTGVAIRGDAATVNVDEWLELAGTSRSSRGGVQHGPELHSVDLESADFVAFGRNWNDMSLGARRAGEGWRMKFGSRQLEGTATWEPAGSKLANGRLSAQLARLELAKLDHAPAEQLKPRAAGSANTWPEIDLTAEHYIARAGDIGRMELSARPEGTDWRVTRFAIVNEAGRIDADGWWRLVGSGERTSFDVKVDVRDSGAFLARMGLPSEVKGAPGKLDGQLEWTGSPTDFEFRALAGSFKVAIGAGQFTKLDPGVGKLLGVLSLQALPRRITLDFRDVFSEGFAFDSIIGRARIAQGVMTTDDLMMVGPAAKVHLAGDVDLDRETQRLSVRVQPSLSSVVSTGAGAAAVALLAANPLVGAAVGAGTLLAQKLMSDPIEQMFSYEYAVRGSWSEPVVERVANRAFQRPGTSATQAESK